MAEGVWATFGVLAERLDGSSFVCGCSPQQRGCSWFGGPAIFVWWRKVTEPEMHSSFTQQVQARYNDLAFTFVDLLVVLLLTSVSINLVLAFQLWGLR